MSEFNVDDFCRKELGIKENYFIREGRVWRVDFRGTYNKNLNNEGTPFVVGSNVNNLTEHIYAKTFLVEWTKQKP